MDNKYVAMLDDAKSFADIFRLVKRVVEEHMGMHCAGLSLVLATLPNNMPAYHELGSNPIILNRALLEAITGIARTRREVNSYVFAILLNEYLHTLGFTKEESREYSKEIITHLLTERLQAFKFASNPIHRIYPELKTMPIARKLDEKPKVIKDFDAENASYIG
ncbi:MAG: hypothetical protein NXY59_03925 [Aigarchaeota archaeon]|nr:hypothetical protein [Candidatus Pelearchaeum maunauluense]